MKRIIALLVLIISLTGCYTKKQAARQVIKAQTVYPELVAANCGLWYPPKEFTKTETQYIPGKDSIIRDTQFVDCTEPGNIDNKSVPVPCDKSIRVDTFIKQVTNQVENTAKIEALTAENKQLKAANDQLTGNNNSLKKQVRGYVIACIILALFFIAKFIK
jgi:hypothetical protein